MASTDQRTRATRTRLATLAAVAAALSMACLRPAPTLAGGVVGTGTAESCTEAALDAALAGGGTVAFDCGAEPVTITIAATKRIADDTTIDGGGLITISGGGAVAVLSATGFLTVRGLTLAGGYAGAGGSGDFGGGISVSGHLALYDSNVTGNAARGGAGIAAFGGLTVVRSTISGNTAETACGGVWSLGDVSVTDSTISGNVGHGICAGGSAPNVPGCGIDVNLTLANSTVSGNEASGEGSQVRSFGTAAIINSSVAGAAEDASIAHGGCEDPGALTLLNTIIAAGGCVSDGTVTGANNVIENAENACGLTNGVDGNLIGVDPLLDPAGLADNGGPTQTIALLPGSPAIDAGDPAVCADSPVDGLDQRGYVRPGAGATTCSIGAYEFDSPGPPPFVCTGDCDGNSVVEIHELTTLVNVALGDELVAACPIGDVNGDGRITIDELVAAVNRALSGCIQQGLLVSLADGLLQGEVVGGARRFLGIPFAAPPVGPLRWRPPAPVVPWHGVRQATHFGGRCAQLGSLYGLPSESEDCLNLNVWTPEPAPAHLLPVMVWVHGGGNSYQSASDPWPFELGDLSADGRTLAEKRQVVVVTIDYRLGVLGFFAHRALATEDPAHPYAGNQGLLDQRAALQWVRRNIAAFGGDPRNVTLFGESAGGFDTCLHLVSPGSLGLFERAIAQSAGSHYAGCTTRQPTAAEAAASADRLVAAVGCDGASDVLACLRQVSVPSLLQAAGPYPTGPSSAVTEFRPVVDGDVLPAQPRALFAAGSVARIPLLFGANADEGTLYLLNGVINPPITTEEQYLAALDERFGERADEVAALYPASDFASPQAALVRVLGDYWLVCPTHEAARRAAAAGLDVWLYNFARPIPIPGLEFLGATHGAEIAYIFQSLDLGPYPIDVALSDAMQGYWTRFARDGDPNGDGAFVWPPYDDASDRRIDFDAELSVVSAFRRSQCELWWELYDREFEPVGLPAAARRPPAGG